MDTRHGGRGGGSGGGSGGGGGRGVRFGGGDAMQKLFEREPPHAVEAEMCLLGAMLLDPRVISDVIPLVLSGECFYTERHAAIYDAIVEVYERRDVVDLVQIAQSLKDRGMLEGAAGVGGPEYLVRLAEQAPGSVNAAHYARIVGEKYRLRRLIDAASQILYEAYHAGERGPDGTKEVLDVAEQMVFDIAETTDASDAQRLSELLHHAMERLEANEGRSITGLTTGYYDLDQLLAGLQEGEMSIIAARPSMGKTTLALNLAEQVALGGAIGSGESERAPVAFFSMEMSKQAVAQRLLSARSGVDAHLLRTNKIGEQHFQKLVRACGELGEAPIFIDDTPGMTVLQLRARVRRMASQHKVKCVFVDYLQLMTAPGAARESRQVEVSAISRGLKALARELNIPVVCLSQLNRGAEQREGHRPRMSDLRESGSIEQDADVVMLLHREDYYHVGDEAWARENPDKIGLAEIIVAKQRNGPTGTVSLTWNSAITRFQNHAGNARFEPDSVVVRPQTKPGALGGSFGSSQRPSTGPVSGHRDGGGPERDGADDDFGDLPI